MTFTSDDDMGPLLSPKARDATVDDRLRSLRVPAFCPVCSFVMKGSKSSASYYSWGCCVDCQIEFVEGREDAWRAGRRPSPEEIARRRYARPSGE